MHSLQQDVVRILKAEIKEAVKATEKEALEPRPKQ